MSSQHLAVKALFDYTPQTPQEVAFHKDDHLTLVNRENPDWWYYLFDAGSL
jgi:hypothetical protein